MTALMRLSKTTMVSCLTAMVYQIRYPRVDNKLLLGESGETSCTDNKLYRVVMECYFESKLGTRGKRKRMLSAWQKRGMFRVREQNLADQAHSIKTNIWSSAVKLVEIKQ